MRRVAENAQPRFGGDVGERAEVDMRSDVFAAGVVEHVGVRAMTVMAHQRAACALRVVVLATREAVIDDEDCALLQPLGERADPRSRSEVDLALIRRRDFDFLRRFE